MMERFHYLSHGLAVILIFVGAKMLLTDVWKIPTWLSLLVIVGLLLTAIGVSLARTAGGPRAVGAAAATSTQEP